MTTVGDAGDTPEDLYIDRVEALSFATTRLRFDHSSTSTGMR